MKIAYNKRLDDNKFINKEIISLYAKTNEIFLSGSVRGIIVELPGLDGCSCLGGDLNRGDYNSIWAKDFGENGIVLAYIFPGP